MLLLVEVLTWKIDVDFNLCYAISIMRKEGKKFEFPSVYKLIDRTKTSASRNFVARLVSSPTLNLIEDARVCLVKLDYYFLNESLPTITAQL